MNKLLIEHLNGFRLTIKNFSIKKSKNNKNNNSNSSHKFKNIPNIPDVGIVDFGDLFLESMKHLAKFNLYLWKVELKYLLIVSNKETNIFDIHLILLLRRAHNEIDTIWNGKKFNYKTK